MALLGIDELEKFFVFFKWFKPYTVVWLCIRLDDSPLYLFQVLAADSQSIENTIRSGGLAVTKASCIQKMLSCLLERTGKLCLEYLRDLTVDEIKTELSYFKGIGPKTVILSLLFLPVVLFTILLAYKQLSAETFSGIRYQ